MRSLRLAIGLLAPAVLASGWVGSTSRYAKYQDRTAAIEEIEALVATIPQYLGARRTGSQYLGTSYKLSPTDYVEAEPYSSALYYDLATTVSGATLQRHFRDVMRARHWSCRVRHRSRGVPYGFGCTRRGAVVSAYVADHGHYELHVTAEHPRPPIKTVPGD
jgi:hypothetical protein